MQKVILAIVAVVVGLLLITTILPDTILEVTTEDYAEPFNVTTGGGVTNTTEELSYSSYYDDLTGISASSDNEDDDPIVMEYDPNTNDVVVAGLEASDNRILTITYVRESRQEFTGFSGFVRLLPFLMIVGLFVAGIMGLYSGIRNR